MAVMAHLKKKLKEQGINFEINKVYDISTDSNKIYFISLLPPTKFFDGSTSYIYIKDKLILVPSFPKKDSVFGKIIMGLKDDFIIYSKEGD